MIINSNIDSMVQYHVEEGNQPDILIQCACAILEDIVNKVETPQGTLEDAIAMLIVANGDF